MSTETADLRRRPPTNRCPECGGMFVEIEREATPVFDVAGPPIEIAASSPHILICEHDHRFDVEAIQHHEDGGYTFNGLTRMR
jgi:hypothetical protein